MTELQEVTSPTLRSNVPDSPTTTRKKMPPSRARLAARSPEERRQLRDPARRAYVLSAGVSPPEHAAAEWAALQRALVNVSTPCRTDPGRWFAEEVSVRQEAAAACAPCPAFGPCGVYADRADERHGVWAGVVRVGSARARRSS